MSNFLSVAFQSSLATESILFAAFGFLYAAYIQYSTLPTPNSPKRNAAANMLARVCRITTVIIGINAVIAIYSLIKMSLPMNIEKMLISSGFAITMLVIVYICWKLAKTM